MKLIRFICVNFNNSSYTIKMCESLQLQIGRDLDYKINCSIVDNSTNNEDSKEIEEYSKNYSWIDYIPAPKNFGYFGGLNYGLSMTSPVDHDFVVICNNDLVFDKYFCNKIFVKKYDENIFAVCPDVVTMDGIHQNPHHLKNISWFRLLQFDLFFSNYYIAMLMSHILRLVRPVKSSPPQPQKGCEIHRGVGACYVLTSEFLRRFDKLNFPHFLYGEEVYFSDQIHAADGILWFDPELLVQHAESATLAKIPKRTAYEFARCGYWDYRKMLL